MTPHDRTPPNLGLAAIEQAWNDGLIDARIEESQRRITASPAWNTPRLIHTSLFVEATCFGILSADFWFRPYRVPEGLERVLNWIAFNAQREYPDTFAELTLNEFEAKITGWLLDSPDVQAWNPNPKRNTMARRYYLALKNANAGETMTERPFIEIESVARNAAKLVDDQAADRHGMNQRLNATRVAVTPGDEATP